MKLALLAVMAVGGVCSFAVPGVYAVFSAETRNLPSKAGSGTLTMDLVVGGGSPCYSYNGPASPGNVNTSCDALATYTPSAELYPGEPKTVTVTVRNDGSLPGSDLLLYMPGGCSPVSTGDAPAPGTGNPCTAGGMQLYVEETTPGGPKCWFPAAAGACSFTSDLATFAAKTTLATALDLGAGPAAQQTRTFTIGLQIPSTADNTYQGRGASFTLDWHLNS
ncbi:MAG TPA: hypothetical protein VFL60_09885 [Gaiellaceae bacterium]|nr:hypothetical protein [Gaiellaceae bacterium]